MALEQSDPKINLSNFFSILAYLLVIPILKAVFLFFVRKKSLLSSLKFSVDFQRLPFSAFLPSRDEKGAPSGWEEELRTSPHAGELRILSCQPIGKFSSMSDVFIDPMNEVGKREGGLLCTRCLGPGRARPCLTGPPGAEHSDELAPPPPLHVSPFVLPENIILTENASLIENFTRNPKSFIGYGKVSVMVDGALRPEAPSQLVPGDIVLLSPGTVVPADIMLLPNLQGESCSVHLVPPCEEALPGFVRPYEAHSDTRVFRPSDKLPMYAAQHPERQLRHLPICLAELQASLLPQGNSEPKILPPKHTALAGMIVSAVSFSTNSSLGSSCQVRGVYGLVISTGASLVVSQICKNLTPESVSVPLLDFHETDTLPDFPEKKVPKKKIPSAELVGSSLDYSQYSSAPLAFPQANPHLSVLRVPQESYQNTGTSGLPKSVFHASNLEVPPASGAAYESFPEEDLCEYSVSVSPIFDREHPPAIGLPPELDNCELETVFASPRGALTGLSEAGAFQENVTPQTFFKLILRLEKRIKKIVVPLTMICSLLLPVAPHVYVYIAQNRPENYWVSFQDASQESIWAWICRTVLPALLASLSIGLLCRSAMGPRQFAVHSASSSLSKYAKALASRGLFLFTLSSTESTAFATTLVLSDRIVFRRECDIEKVVFGFGNAKKVFSKNEVETSSSLITKHLRTHQDAMELKPIDLLWRIAVATLRPEEVALLRNNSKKKPVASQVGQPFQRSLQQSLQMESTLSLESRSLTKPFSSNWDRAFIDPQTILSDIEEHFIPFFSALIPELPQNFPHNINVEPAAPILLAPLQAGLFRSTSLENDEQSVILAVRSHSARSILPYCGAYYVPRNLTSQLNSVISGFRYSAKPLKESHVEQLLLEETHLRRSHLFVIHFAFLPSSTCPTWARITDDLRVQAMANGTSDYPSSPDLKSLKSPQSICPPAFKLFPNLFALGTSFSSRSSRIGLENRELFYDSLSTRPLIYMGSICFSPVPRPFVLPFLNRISSPYVSLSTVFHTELGEEACGSLAKKLSLRLVSIPAEGDECPDTIEEPSAWLVHDTGKVAAEQPASPESVKRSYELKDSRSLLHRSYQFLPFFIETNDVSISMMSESEAVLSGDALTAPGSQALPMMPEQLPRRFAPGTAHDLEALLRRQPMLIGTVLAEKTRGFWGQPNISLDDDEDTHSPALTHDPQTLSTPSDHQLAKPSNAVKANYLFPCLLCDARESGNILSRRTLRFIVNHAETSASARAKPRLKAASKRSALTRRLLDRLRHTRKKKHAESSGAYSSQPLYVDGRLPVSATDSLPETPVNAVTAKKTGKDGRRLLNPLLAGSAAHVEFKDFEWEGSTDFSPSSEVPECDQSKFFPVSFVHNLPDKTAVHLCERMSQAGARPVMVVPRLTVDAPNAVSLVGVMTREAARRTRLKGNEKAGADTLLLAVDLEEPDEQPLSGRAVERTDPTSLLHVFVDSKVLGGERKGFVACAWARGRRGLDHFLDAVIETPFFFMSLFPLVLNSLKSVLLITGLPILILLVYLVSGSLLARSVGRLSLLADVDNAYTGFAVTAQMFAPPISAALVLLFKLIFVSVVPNFLLRVFPPGPARAKHRKGSARGPAAPRAHDGPIAFEASPFFGCKKRAFLLSSMMDLFVKKTKLGFTLLVTFLEFFVAALLFMLVRSYLLLGLEWLLMPGAFLPELRAPGAACAAVEADAAVPLSYMSTDLSVLTVPVGTQALLLLTATAVITAGRISVISLPKIWERSSQTPVPIRNATAVVLCLALAALLLLSASRLGVVSVAIWGTALDVIRSPMLPIGNHALLFDVLTVCLACVVESVYSWRAFLQITARGPAPA